MGLFFGALLCFGLTLQFLFLSGIPHTGGAMWCDGTANSTSSTFILCEHSVLGNRVKY